MAPTWGENAMVATPLALILARRANKRFYFTDTFC